MKPLFYMLAKHGPWAYHVRVKSTDVMNEIVMWMASNRKAEDIDYEILIEGIENKMTRRTVIQTPSGLNKTMTSIEPIFFLNDASIATYIKLTWGGR